MKSILFRASLVSMLAASAVCAQPPSSFEPNPPAGSRPTLYHVTDLGTLGGTFSTAFGVNNAGRIGGLRPCPTGMCIPSFREWGH